MRFKCKQDCGFVHENSDGFHWTSADDKIVFKHELECPKGARKEYDGTYE